MGQQISMQKNFLTVAITLLMTIAMSACGNRDQATETSSTGSSNLDSESMKAIADAEAAEEAFAQEKKASAKRGISSVKKAAKSADSESIFVVQVGTFKVEENAKKIVEKLKAAGLPVVQKKIERENGTVYYTVRFEPTPNRVEAEKFVSSVKAATGESSLILSVGN